jgi:hypothetical protein
MDKEIIELLKSLAGNAETLVIWYMVLDLAKTLIGWAGGNGHGIHAGPGHPRLRQVVGGCLRPNVGANLDKTL